MSRSVSRRSVLALGGGAALAAGTPAARATPASSSTAGRLDPREPVTLGVAALQQELTGGQLTSRRLVRRYLRRIDRVDAEGPTLRSVIEVNPDAEDIARDLDLERRRGEVRGPLHGIPVLLKDNIDTGDAMLTTAGSLALVDSRPGGDATVVERLREAGMVVLGKTNLSEWANFRSTQSSSGWSARGGQTKKP